MNGPCVCDTVCIRGKRSILHGCDVTFNGGRLKCENTWCFIGTLLYRASESSGTGAASASLSFKENKKKKNILCVSHFNFHLLYLAF